MKKLPEYTSDDNMFFYMNALVDLVNSQQEAIEKLERVFETQTVPDIMLPATKKPYKIIEMNPSELSQLLDTEQADDTHRTVTLRIPKDECLGGVILDLADKVGSLSLYNLSDTDLQKALDEVQPNE